jgi:hypothetical protein
MVFEMSKPRRSEPADFPRKNRYFYGILFSQMMFEELARNKGFAVFTTFKSVWDKEESFFRKLFWERWTSHIGVMREVVHQWNDGVNVGNVSPYIGEKVQLNVISPFHLIAHAITLEHV